MLTQADHLGAGILYIIVAEYTGSFFTFALRQPSARHELRGLLHSVLLAVCLCNILADVVCE